MSDLWESLERGKRGAGSGMRGSRFHYRMAHGAGSRQERPMDPVGGGERPMGPARGGERPVGPVGGGERPVGLEGGWERQMVPASGGRAPGSPPPDVPEPADRVPVRPGDIWLQEGFTLEPVVVGLNFPTSLTFDDTGRLYVCEGGFSYGTSMAEERGRILRVESDGQVVEVASGFRGPVTAITWHRGFFHVAEGAYPGRILRVDREGNRQVLVDGLRSGADHYTSDIAFGPNGKMYFSVGSATNASVVGVDNFYLFDWLARMPAFHDVPARDLVLNGQDFRSVNPFEINPIQANVLTGAYHPFGEPAQAGEVIKGRLLANSAMYEVNPDGTGLRIFLDGIRNIFGLRFTPDGGRLFFTENGFDPRGSRPIPGLEALWQAVEGGWYGFPDFSAGVPVTDPMFQVPGAPPADFVLAHHPPLATRPTAIFAQRSAPMKFDFSTSERFGFRGWAFVTLFGTFNLAEPVGFRVVRVNVDTGETADFLVINNPRISGTGPIHPIEARFSPDGEILYLLDFGPLFSFGGPVVPWASGGILWRIRRG